MSTELERREVDRSRVRRVHASAAPGDDRRFVATFLTALATLLLLITGVTFLVDARGYFGVGVFEPVVVADRDRKAAAFADLDRSPNTLILGSSRSFKLDPALVEALGGGTAFNFAVSGAHAEDYLAVLRFALERSGGELHRLIIGVDERAFAQRQGLNPSLIDSHALRPYAPGRRRLDIGDLGARLLSVETLRVTFRSLRHALGEAREEAFEFGPDGFLESTPWEGLMRRGEYDQAREITAALAIYRPPFQRYGALAPERVGYFTELVALAHARGIRVDALIPPLHPAVLTALEGTGAAARIEDTRALLRRLEARGLLHYHETADLASFGGTARDYYDGVHMTEPNAHRLLAHVLERSDDDALQ